MARQRADRDAVPPPGLLVFDGREFPTAAEWTEGYELWFDSRDQWEADHPGVVLPEKRVLSSCPFDADMIGLPHGGLWSRLPHSDRSVCAAHDLEPGEH